MKTPLIAVKSCFEYRYEPSDVGAAHRNGKDELRSKSIRDTWYKDWEKVSDQISLKFFYGLPPEGGAFLEENSIILECPDDYPNLPLKTRGIFEWALDSGYESVLLCDDDIYVWIFRILADIQTWQTPPTYRGHSNGWFCSGAAYWINRYAMECVLMEPWKKEQWAEDQHCGKCLEKHGITPEHDDRYIACPCDICLKKIDLGKRLTQLTSNPQQMYDLHNATVRTV